MFLFYFNCSYKKTKLQCLVSCAPHHWLWSTKREKIICSGEILRFWVVGWHSAAQKYPLGSQVCSCITVPEMYTVSWSKDINPTLLCPYWFHEIQQMDLGYRHTHVNSPWTFKRKWCLQHALKAKQNKNKQHDNGLSLWNGK